MVFFGREIRLFSIVWITLSCYDILGIDFEEIRGENYVIFMARMGSTH